MQKTKCDFIIHNNFSQIRYVNHSGPPEGKRTWGLVLTIFWQINQLYFNQRGADYAHLINNFPHRNCLYSGGPGHDCVYLPASEGTVVPYHSSSVSTTLSDLKTLAFKYLLKANGTNFVSKEGREVSWMKKLKLKKNMFERETTHATDQ